MFNTTFSTKKMLQPLLGEGPKMAWTSRNAKRNFQGLTSTQDRAILNVRCVITGGSCSCLFNFFFFPSCTHGAIFGPPDHWLGTTKLELRNNFEATKWVDESTFWIPLPYQLIFRPFFTCSRCTQCQKICTLFLISLKGPNINDVTQIWKFCYPYPL